LRMTPKELKQWRLQNAYSQNDLAGALGIIKLTVSRWERGDREVPPYLHLALKSLPKRGGEIRTGRPKGSKTKTKGEK
jgi:transcriptional regulator with XRE-family HTH domain